MYDENGRFSWTSLFIKIIIIIIFVLFTIWLLSLSTKNATKGLSNSLNVLTDNIYQENIDRMKDVGKDYFTTERLPEKVGDVKTLTLASMYDKNLILEVKDKNGKACSAKDSYVSVEKLETEYQMKVYLKCGNESNFIKVIMGCYNYCNTDICEKKNNTTPVAALEYQYSKTTGGKWTPWGNWSEWSKTSVTKTNSRDAETKTVEEEYTYEETITDTTYTGEASCPSVPSYTLIEVRKGVCTYTKTITDTANLSCPSVSGYTYTGISGSTCNYSKAAQTTNPTCPSVSGYTYTSRNGFTCNYSQSSSATAELTCPSLSGYTNTGRSGLTCNYSKSSSSTADPVCPSVTNFTLSSRSGFTCNYSRQYQEPIGKQLVTTCSGCAATWQTIYETKYEYTTKTASCPSGYTKSGSSCTRTTTSTATKAAVCPSGYTQSGTSCTKTTTSTTTKTATCPSGYTKSGSSCVIAASTTTRTASCPSGYSIRNGLCAKDTTSKIAKDAVCPSGERFDEGKCYVDKITKIPTKGVRKVTYYRYRVRSYVGGTTDYKWSTSKNDKSLINAGYRLTGKTRNVGGK